MYEYSAGKPGLITVRQAAALCGKDPETIRRWIWSGKIKAQKLGNQLFLEKSQLTGCVRETAVAEYKTDAGPGSRGRFGELSHENGGAVKGSADAGAPGGSTPGGYMKIAGERGRGTNATGMSEGEWWERARALRERMRVRGMKPIDAAETIRMLREERTREL